MKNISLFGIGTKPSNRLLYKVGSAELSAAEQFESMSAEQQKETIKTEYKNAAKALVEEMDNINMNDLPEINIDSYVQTRTEAIFRRVLPEFKATVHGTKEKFKAKYREAIANTLRKLAESIPADKKHFEEKINNILNNGKTPEEQNTELAKLSSPKALTKYVNSKNLYTSEQSDKLIKIVHQRAWRSHRNILRTIAVRQTMDAITNNNQDADFLVGATAQQKAESAKFLVKATETQKRKTSTYSALTTASIVDKTLKNRNIRQQISTEMTTANNPDKAFPELMRDEVEAKGLEYDSAYMIVGGEKLPLHEHELGKFVLKHWHIDENNKMHAQTKNGCEGNLVVAQFKPKTNTDTDTPDGNTTETNLTIDKNTGDTAAQIDANAVNPKEKTNQINKDLIHGTEHKDGDLDLSTDAIDKATLAQNLATTVNDIMESTMKGRTFEGGVIGLVTSLFKDKRLINTIKKAEAKMMKENPEMKEGDLQKAIEEKIMPQMLKFSEVYKQVLAKFDNASKKYDASSQLQLKGEKGATQNVKLKGYKEYFKKDIAVIAGSAATSALLSLIQGNPISLAIAVPITWMRTGMTQRLANSPDINTVSKALLNQSYDDIIKEALAEQSKGTARMKNEMKDAEAMAGVENLNQQKATHEKLMKMVEGFDKNIQALENNISNAEQNDLFREKGKVDGFKHESGQFDKMRRSAYGGILEKLFSDDRAQVRKLINEARELSEKKGGKDITSEQLLGINTQISTKINEIQTILGREHEEDFGLKIEQSTGEVTQLRLGGDFGWFDKGMEQVYAVRDSGTDKFQLAIGRGQGERLYEGGTDRKRFADLQKITVDTEDGKIVFKNADTQDIIAAKELSSEEKEFFNTLLEDLNNGVGNKEKLQETIRFISQFGQERSLRRGMKQYKKLNASKKLSLNGRNLDGFTRLSGMRETQRKTIVREAFANAQKEQIFMQNYANDKDFNAIKNARYAFIDQFYQASNMAQSPIDFIKNATGQFPATQAVKDALTTYFYAYKNAESENTTTETDGEKILQKMKTAIKNLNDNKAFQEWTMAIATGHRAANDDSKWESYMTKVSNEQVKKYQTGQPSPFEERDIKGVQTFGPDFGYILEEHTTPEARKQALVDHMVNNVDSHGNSIMTRIISHLASYQKLNLSFSADEIVNAIKNNAEFDAKAMEDFIRASNEGHGTRSQETKFHKSVLEATKVLVPLKNKEFSYINSNGEQITIVTDLRIALNAECTNPMIEFPKGQYQKEKVDGGYRIQFYPDATVRTYQRMPITAVIARIESATTTSTPTRILNKDALNSATGEGLPPHLQNLINTIPEDATFQNVKDALTGIGNIPDNIATEIANGLFQDVITSETINMVETKLAAAIIPIPVRDSHKVTVTAPTPQEKPEEKKEEKTTTEQEAIKAVNKKTENIKDATDF